MDCGRGITWIFGQNLWTDADENLTICTPSLLTESETRRRRGKAERGNYVRGHRSELRRRATHVVPAPLLPAWVAWGVD